MKKLSIIYYVVVIIETLILIYLAGYNIGYKSAADYTIKVIHNYNRTNNYNEPFYN